MHRHFFITHLNIYRGVYICLTHLTPLNTVHAGDGCRRYGRHQSGRGVRQRVEELFGGQVLPGAGRVQPLRRPDGQLDATRGRVDRGRGRAARQLSRAVRAAQQPVPVDRAKVPHVQLGHGRLLHGAVPVADRPDGRPVNRSLFQPRHILAER